MTLHERTKKFCHGSLQGIREFADVHNPNVPFTAFDPADVIPM